MKENGFQTILSVDLTELKAFQLFNNMIFYLACQRLCVFIPIRYLKNIIQNIFQINFSQLRILVLSFSFLKFFYRCKYCKKLAPEWQQLAEDMRFNNDIKILKVIKSLLFALSQKFWPILADRYNAKRDSLFVNVQIMNISTLYEVIRLK